MNKLAIFYAHGQPVSGDEVIGLATAALEQFLKMEKNTDKSRRGGYLTVLDLLTGQLILQVRLGSIPAEKDAAFGTADSRYRELSGEKARRALRLFRLRGHLSSWQSRDDRPEKMHYGGAVVSWPFVFSFSGLSEHGDEVISLFLGAKYGDADMGHIGELSQNPFWPDLYDQMKETTRWE